MPRHVRCTASPQILQLLQGMLMEQRAKWRFMTRGDGEWRWAAAEVDGAEAAASLSAFASVEDCMADAARHGYANYAPTEAAYP